MSALGFVVRLLYFLVVPFTVVFVHLAIPMLGVLINFVLLIAGFMFIEVLRRSADRHRIVGTLARRQLRLEEFYREHPPRMFLYYMLYPLLFPYWLFNRVARRELGLYRGYTALGVVLLVVFGFIDYMLNWAPEIAFREFLAGWFASFILQLFVLFAFLMPLCVTIVGYQLAGRRRSVSAMLGTAGVSLLLAVVGVAGQPDPIVPAPTLSRARQRGEAAPERAHAARAAALTSVWQDLRDRRAEFDAEGWLIGVSLARARAELAGFYRRDEAAAFQVRVWPTDQPTGVLLQCRQNNDRPPVWLAMAADGTQIHDAAEVPAGILDSRPTPRRRDPR